MEYEFQQQQQLGEKVSSSKKVETFNHADIRGLKFHGADLNSELLHSKSTASRILLKLRLSKAELYKNLYKKDNMHSCIHLYSVSCTGDDLEGYALVYIQTPTIAPKLTEL